MGNRLVDRGSAVHGELMELSDAAQAWHTHGFVILPDHIPADELAPAVSELGILFPSADDFHDGIDPERSARYIGDEFAGIDTFPFASVELGLLAVNHRLVRLAGTLLGGDDLRIYSAEAWAKYTGAAEYDQALHRDYLNHTVLVPTSTPGYEQLEMFVYLVDVPEQLGPPHFVSRTLTTDLSLKPNWYPRTGTTHIDDGFVSTTGRPELYEAEESGAGPAGTVVAFQIGTFHRGTAMTEPRGARYTMHVNYRPASVEWGHRQAWADRSHEPVWYRFVDRASPRQLELFGFPPPGHPFWTRETLAGMGLRYPNLDLSPWHK